MKKDISRAFISYSHKDKSFVSRLIGDLASLGANLWIDLVEMKVGDSIVRKIEDGIEESEWLVIVLSPDSVESTWVKTELNAALVNELEKDEVFVLPLLYRECKIPMLLRDKVYADFTASYDEGLKALVDRLTPEINPEIFKAILSDEYSLIRRSWNKVADSDKGKYVKLVKRKLFSDVNAERRAAMAALYIIDRKALKNHLIALASDEATSVVRSALFYIGELGMKEGISIVSQKMSDGTPHIRAAARDAYRKIS